MNRFLTAAFLSFFILFVAPRNGSSQSFPQWGNLQPGPYAVGYRTIRMTDASRTYAIKDGLRIPRPMQIYVWYPAAKTTKPLMTFGEYFNDVGFDQVGYKDPEVLKNYILTEFRNGPLFPSYNQALSPEVYEKILATKTASVRDAEPASERFPLVIHFPGSLNQSVLIEFLVSHGYVVASMPLIGTSPATYGRGDASKNSPLVQMEDLQFAFRELCKQEFVDSNSASMIGMFAQVGLALQMKDQLFKSIACLDCSLQSDELQTGAFYDPRKVKIPFLEILNSDQNTKPTVTDSLLYLKRYEVDFKNFPHADFYPFKRIAKPENSADDKNYEYISEITLNFLNATLKNDREAEKRLAANTGIPETIATISIHEPLPSVPTETEFLTWLRDGEIEKAKSAYALHGRKISTRDPFFFSIVFLARDRAPHAWETIKMFVDAYPGHPRILRYLNIYGYYFLNQEHNFREVKFAFRTMLRDYPESPYAHDAWADYLIEVGNAQESLIHSEKVITLTESAQLQTAEKDGLVKSAKEKIDRLQKISGPSLVFKNGNLNVGFTSFQTRTEANDLTTISIWYPSERLKTKMRLRDYVLADIPDKSKSEAERLNEFESIAERIYNIQLSPEEAANGFATQGIASANAKNNRGRFPLILASAAPAYYYEIFEALASHGFVVASTTTNFSTPSPSPDSPDHYTRYTDALDYLKKYMIKQKYVDTTNITAFGHGGGIQAAMYLAMRSPSVKRVINLDGGFFGPRSLTTNARDYHPANFKIPLLHIVTSPQNAEDDADQFAAIKTSITKVTLPSKAVRHHDFTSWKTLTQSHRSDDELKMVKLTLSAVNTIMLQFLTSKPMGNYDNLILKVEKFNQ